MRSAVDAGLAAEEVVVGVAVFVEEGDGFVEVADEAVSDGAVQPRISPAESGALRGRIGS